MPVKKLDADGLWNWALRLLGARAYSASEIRGKLFKRAERVEDVAPAIQKLKEYGYLDDRRFADSFASARLENQGLGRQRVLSDLAKRRVASGLARQAVDKVFQDTDETALIREYLTRKFRRVDLAEHLAEPKKLAAAYQRLRRAGFSTANSIQVLKRYSEQADSLEGMEDSSAVPDD